MKQAGEGVGGALVVAGEPGVGKSVLLSFAAEEAERRGFAILRAAGIESESELPYAGLQALLAPLTDRLDRIASPRAAALAGALGLARAENDDRLAIYLAAFDLLSMAAEPHPVLVLADDLHWLDGASRDAVLFVARRASSTPVVVLAGIRMEQLGAVSDDSIERLEVAGLAEDAGVRLALEARADLSRDVAGELWEGTDGNPLALVEIAPLLTESQARGCAPLDDPLPAGPRLQRVFSQRFVQLPLQTRRLVLIGAASHTGSTEVIRTAGEALGLDVAALELAEIVGLVTIDSGTIRWRHPLLRAAVYNGASGPERRAAHRALAEAGGEERLDDHRAWHLAAAATQADESIAAGLERLAERARSRGALSTTARALHHAAGLTPDEDERARRLIAASEAAAATGNWDEATAMIAEADRRTSSQLLYAQATRVLARVEIVRGSPDVAHGRLVATAETITELDLPLAATMMTEAVVAHMATGNWDAYQRTATRALELGKRVGGPIEAVAGIALGTRHAGTRPDAALELFEHYENVVWEPDLWHQAPEIVAMYALCHVWIERFEVAERLLDEMISSARRSASLRVLPFPLAVSAHLNFRRGRWRVAYRQAVEAVVLSRELLVGAVLANTLAYLVQIEAALGQVEAAREHANESLELCQGLSIGGVAMHSLQGLALLDLSEGKYESAIRDVKRIDPNVDRGCNEPGLSMWRPLLIEAYARTGRTQVAEARLAELEDWSDITGRSLGHAHAARCRGLLAPDNEIEPHFQRALDWHRRVDLPFERAWTQLCYGERLRRGHRRAAAREQLAGSADTFRTLGAQLWLRRAEAELQAAGARHPDPQQPADWEDLSHQERRVAQLIIDGATYQEAAGELFLSVRTIESHLRQIYRKLGVRSRTELTRLLSAVQSSTTTDP